METQQYAEPAERVGHVAGDVAATCIEAEIALLLSCDDKGGEADGSARAWLCYRIGRQVAWRDPSQARGALTEAYEYFLGAENVVAARLVLCARIEVELHRWGDPAMLRDLVNGIDPESLLRRASPESPAQTLLALTCAAAALAIADPLDARIGAWVMRAYQQLGKVADAGVRMRAASKLLLCTPWLPAGIPMALVREYDGVCSSQDVSPWPSIEWCCTSAWWQLEWGGQLDAAQALLDAGLRTADKLMLPRAAYRLNLLQARLHIVRGRHLDAIDLMARLAGQPDVGDEHEKAQIALLKPLVYGAAGDVVSGSALAHELCHSQKVLGSRQLERCRFAQAMATLCAGAGQAQIAREWSTLARSWACAGEEEEARITHNLIEAFFTAASGESSAGGSRLTEAISAHRRRFMPGLFVSAPGFASMVAELLLEANAESDYVQEIVRAQHLNPAGRVCAAWPWRVKVCVLGPVSVFVDGQPVGSGGRAQRLLELLRILAAAGPAGRSQQTLERHLWAESEGPKAALAVALHRLRKLLGSDRAIVANGGILSLSPQYIWTDVDAMLELCGRIESLPPDASQLLAQRLASQLFSIYRGALDHESDDPWLVSCGARLRANFIAAAELLAHRLEGFKAWHAAGRLYRRMLDAEPLCETAYRGLMRVAHAQGDLAAAFAHYRFCRDTLSVVLNRPPSRDTRELAETLGLFEQIVRPTEETPSTVKSITSRQHGVYPNGECADL